jgi:hypothetical protein
MILAVIDRAYAEREKSGENAGEGGVRSRGRSGPNLKSESLIHELLISGLWRRLRRSKSGCGRNKSRRWRNVFGWNRARRRSECRRGRNVSRRRRGSIQTRGEALLAVNHSANVAGAGLAKWLAAGAAEGHRSGIAVCGAVHTNLLYVVTGTTGRSQESKHGPNGAMEGALARMS